MNETAHTAETIFAEAIDIAMPADRVAFLERACEGDAGLREAVEKLVDDHFRAGSFLESPVFDLAATAEMSAITDAPGTVIGRYKLRQQIGEGGMGVVFMAEQTEPIQRTVALKIIKPGMDTRRVIARFEAERQALAMMDHPNIAKVLDAGTTDSGQPYFVMELVKGVPITQYCDENHFSLRQRLELFKPVCEAVQHAHQKGIIHRDLKPTNVLVAEYDNRAVPKVIDFGVAKATAHNLTERTMFTELGQVIGTVEYMSPEQAKLNQLDIDTRSDIYSLGVLLYELLTGSTPFERQRLREAAFDEVLRIIREEEPPNPSMRLSTIDTLPSVAANRHTEPARLNKDLRGELDWIVMKCLEKDRNRRYETANGLALDIVHYLADEQVRACPPSLTYRLRKLTRRYRISFTIGVAFLLLLVAATVVSGWLAMRARQAEGLAQMRFDAEKEARGRAVAEAAKATAISTLLQEALQSANPDYVKGAEYTVRQLLDDLSERLDSQLKDQPEAEAAIHATIGNAYRRLGIAEHAESHLQKALKLRQHLLGPDHPDVAQSHLDHSFNAFERGSLAPAEAESRQALAILQKRNIKDERILRAFSLLVIILREQRKYVEAEAIGDQALAFAHEAGLGTHREVAMILHNLVPLKVDAGDAAGAEILAIKAVATNRRVNGNDHPETGWALYHLGYAYAAQQKNDEAEKSFRDALTTFRKQFGESHESIILTSQALQKVLTAKGDKAGLAALSADKAARLGKAVELHAGDLNLQIQFANVLRGAGDLNGALAQVSTVIAKDPTLADAWTARGECYFQLGQFANAAEDYSSAIKLNPDRSDVWTGRAFAYFHRQQWEQAVADFTKAIELAPEVHTNWLHRGHCYLQLAQWDKAAADFTKIIEGWPHDQGGWFFRGCAYAQLNQPEKAISDLRQAIAEGFKDIAHLKNEPRLDPLRSNDEFKNMMSAMQAEHN